jgi:hypothetical protein
VRRGYALYGSATAHVLTVLESLGIASAGEVAVDMLAAR